ncbi:MAG: TetR/AcrR family transcriptional regulator [Myxococcota bacterium]|jgi:AcrR family transcriptional regulator|nr:TetR/AcrR family transcriptional regulator [Myxococcota bacterium]
MAGNKGRDKADTQEKILTAATELFIADGYEATTVRDIAVRAGVGRATVFWHFSDKASVFREAFTRMLAPFRDSLGRADTNIEPSKRLEQQIASSKNFAEAHGDEITACVRWALESPDLREIVVETLLDLNHRFAGSLAETVSDLIPADRDPKLIAHGLMLAFDATLLLGFFDQRSNSHDERVASVQALVAVIQRDGEITADRLMDTPGPIVETPPSRREMGDSEADLSRSQAAWNRFSQELARIGEKIVGPTGARNARERAEGYRYLVRLLSAAHQLEMDIDRKRPTLARMMTPIRKFKGDGPDTLYYEAKLDENLEYEVYVRRGDDIFFSLTVYAFDENGAYKIVDGLFDHDMVFENVFGEQVAKFHVSAERPEGVANWLRLEGERPILFSREYFPETVLAVDAGRYRPAIMNIECVSEVEAPAVYSEPDLEAGLQRVLDFVEDATDVSIGLSVFAGLNLIAHESETGGKKTSMTRIDDGVLIHEDESGSEYTPVELAQMIDPRLVANNLPGPGIDYLGAWFNLNPDEAIRISGIDVPCRYWSCQIMTRYLESADFRYGPIGINNRQIKKGEDEAFVIYASAENPGVENWISTQGYTNAHIVFRTLLAETPMKADFSVVKISEIETL